MQAITYDRYGSPDLLQLRELATPAIGADEVLIRAHAASVHPGDLFSVLGSPFPVRLSTGIRRPKHGVPGFDVAGTVETVGAAVTHISPATRSLASGSAPAPSSFAPRRTSWCPSCRCCPSRRRPP